MDHYALQGLENLCVCGDAWPESDEAPSGIRMDHRTSKVDTSMDVYGRFRVPYTKAYGIVHRYPAGVPLHVDQKDAGEKGHFLIQN